MDASTIILFVLLSTITTLAALLSYSVTRKPIVQRDAEDVFLNTVGITLYLIAVILIVIVSFYKLYSPINPNI